MHHVVPCGLAKHSCDVRFQAGDGVFGQADPPGVAGRRGPAVERDDKHAARAQDAAQFGEPGWDVAPERHVVDRDHPIEGAVGEPGGGSDAEPRIGAPGGHRCRTVSARHVPHHRRRVDTGDHRIGDRVGEASHQPPGTVPHLKNLVPWPDVGQGDDLGARGLVPAGHDHAAEPAEHPLRPGEGVQR